MSLRDVFDAPTVTQLSARIERLLLAKLEGMSEEETRTLLHQHERALNLPVSA